MEDRIHEVYNDSFQRCLSKPNFLAYFYELFLNASPEVREKFKNTDFKQQTRIIKKSLYSLTLASVGTKESRAEIERLGHSHGKEGLKIPAYLYDLWLDCLLQAVQEYDVGWTPEVERCWRKMLEPHIEKLKRYS